MLNRIRKELSFYCHFYGEGFAMGSNIFKR